MFSGFNTNLKAQSPSYLKGLYPNNCNDEGWIELREPPTGKVKLLEERFLDSLFFSYSLSFQKQEKTMCRMFQD